MTGRGRAANTGRGVTHGDDMNGEGGFEGPLLWSSTLLLPISSTGIETEIPKQTHHDDKLYPAVGSVLNITGMTSSNLSPRHSPLVLSF